MARMGVTPVPGPTHDRDIKIAPEGDKSSRDPNNDSITFRRNQQV